MVLRVQGLCRRMEALIEIVLGQVGQVGQVRPCLWEAMTTEQRSPLARYQRPASTAATSPPRRGFYPRQPPPPDAAQQIASIHEMMILRLNRAIPAGIAIPPDVIQQPPEIDAAWLAGDVEAFREATAAYQRQLWNWFRSTPEGQQIANAGK